MIKQKQNHLLPFISIFLVVVLIALVVESDVAIDHNVISIAVLLYLVSNIAYAFKKKELTLARILEFGAVALLVELIAFRFLI